MDLKTIKTEIHKSSIIKNLGFLQSDYIPEVLLFRDDIIKYLVHTYKRVLVEPFFSSNALLLGPIGTGKTTIAKFFSENFRKIAIEDIPLFTNLYLNCLEYRSEDKIIAAITEKIFCQSRGFCSYELWIQLFKYLINKKAHLLIILDEAHNLPKEDLVNILNLSEAFGVKNTPISFLLISRIYDWNLRETERILSRLHIKIKLEPYSYEETKEILEKRIEKSLIEDVISEKILKKISEIAHKTGNIRNGINILRNAVLSADADSGVITMELIDQFSKEAYSQSRETLDCLKVHEVLTYLSVLKALMSNKGERVSITQCYNHYEWICKVYNTKTHVPMSFRKHIRALELGTYITSKNIKILKNSRGRMKLINARYSPLIISEIIKYLNINL